MSLIVTKDLEFSHGVLNYLNSGFQGAFAQANVLSQFGLPVELIQTPEQMRNAIQFANQLLDEIWEGRALYSLSWQKVENPEASLAFELLLLLMSENASLADDLIEFLQRGLFHDLGVDQLRRCIATFSRYAYSRDNYLRGLHELAKRAKRIDSQKLYRQSIADSERLVSLAHMFLNDFQRSTNQAPEFYAALYAQVVILPGLLRAQAHDINQMVTIYAGEFTFERAFIPADEGAKWTALGLSAREAGYWLAFDIDASEAVRWAENGIMSHQEAGLWRAWGFLPEHAVGWFQFEFEPPEAATWANAHISPKDARHYVKHGVSHPSLIKG